MDDLGISLTTAALLLLLMLLLSAFFSAAETALLRARRARLKVLADQGSSGARRALALLGRTEDLLATVLVGNNFLNFAAASLTTAVLLGLFGEAGMLYATLVMTVVVVVFSEILPKTIAVAHAENIATHGALPLRWSMWLLAPVVRLFMLVVHFCKRLLGIREVKDELTHQELSTLIDMSAESGVVDAAREQMLSSSLHLHEVAVKSLMTPRHEFVLLDGGESVADCLKRAVRQPHSRYPVFHGQPDNLIGIVHLRDLVKLNGMESTLFEAVRWRHPSYIPGNKSALAQLFDFQAQRQHMAIIVDEFGDIDGLITLEDIIEEIVGEIVDESDAPEASDIWPQQDGSLVAAGTVAVHEINQALDISLPEEGATTIGGLIIDTLGDAPEGRLCLLHGEAQIEVLRLHDGMIRRLRIARRGETPE